MLKLMGNYRELEVWQRAQRFALKIYRSTEAYPVRERYGLASQMRRAAVSVASNIAEGCGRQGDRELARFLRIARGSVHEVECQLMLAGELGYLKQETCAEFQRSTEELSRMLNRLIRSFPARK
jgi:four helix bundle protein